MSENNLIKRLHSIQDIEPNITCGLTAITREDVEIIKATAGEAEILIHRLAFLYCDNCGVCPKKQQNPFDCEILGMVTCCKPEENAADRGPGEWLITDSYPHNVYCSRCFRTFAQEHWEVWRDGRLPRDFCPSCGAKMKVKPPAPPEDAP